MQQLVTVTKILPDGRAEILCRRASACSGNCTECGGCSEGQSQEVRAAAENPIGALPGDIVRVESRAGSVLRAVWLVYGLPLLLLLGGLPFLDGWGAAIGFALGIVLAILADRHMSRKRSVSYTITAFADGRPMIQE